MTATPPSQYPGGPYPPAGSDPAAYPPSQPRRGRARTIVIVVGVLVLLCCAGLIGGGFLFFRTIQNAIGPARDAASVFVDHLEAGQTDAAYQQLCDSTRSRFSAVQFAGVVGARPHPISHTVQSTNVSNVNGKVTATVGIRVHYADGSSDLHAFQLLRESGSWRICGDPY